MIESNFKKNLSLFKNLKTIKGISDKWALKICYHLGVNQYILLKDLSSDKTNQLYGLLSSFKKLNKKDDIFIDEPNKLIERDLDVFTKSQIQLLISLNTYRGRRIKQGYPAHGQRTWSNGKTAKKLSRRYKNL